MNGFPKSLLRVFLLPALVLLAACADDSQTPPDASASEHDPTAMEYIKLDVGPCFGACPVYSITLYGDGRVIFYGTRFTKTLGQVSDTSTTGHFLDALETLKTYDFAGLESDYTGKACSIQATDHPMIEITVKSQDYDKSVRWDTGCRGNDDLVRLERLVNDLKWSLQVDTYIGTDMERKPTLRQRADPKRPGRHHRGRP